MGCFPYMLTMGLINRINNLVIKGLFCVKHAR